MVKRPQLAKTLEKIAEEGSGAFYGGDIASSIVDAVRESPFGPGIMTVEDLSNYKARVEKPVHVTFSGELRNMHDVPSLFLSSPLSSPM